MLPFQEELGVEDRVVTQVSLQDVSCAFLTRVLESAQKLSPPQCGNDSGLRLQCALEEFCMSESGNQWFVFPLFLPLLPHPQPSPPLPSSLCPLPLPSLF